MVLCLSNQSPSDRYSLGYMTSKAYLEPQQKIIFKLQLLLFKWGAKKRRRRRRRRSATRLYDCRPSSWNKGHRRLLNNYPTKAFLSKHGLHQQLIYQ